MSEKGDLEQQRPVLVNPVLAYGYVRLQKVSLQETRDSLLATFEDEEFSEAKDALRKHVELEKGDCNGLLGEQPKRRNSKVRTSTQADCEDVLNALSTLKRSGDLPRLAISVGELLVLPPILPQLILSKRRASALEGAEEQVRLSQESIEKTLASFQEVQQKMATELSQLRIQMNEAGADGSTSTASVQPRPEMPHTHPLPPSMTYSQVTTLRPPWRAMDPPPHPAYSLHPQQSRQGKRRKGKVTTGTDTCAENGRFVGAPPVASIFVYHVQKKATEEDLRQWLKERKGVDSVAIRTMSHPNGVLRSFKVTVLKDDVKNLLCPDFGWPTDVKVRRFTPERRRTSDAAMF